MVEKGDGGCIVYKKNPGKYEAGTQNIAGALGLEAALCFLKAHDFPALAAYEKKLGTYLKERLKDIPGLRLLGPDICTTVQTFELEGFGAYDIGVLLGRRGIAIRCGAHCAYPLLKRMERESTCRVSLSFYNTYEEADQLAEALKAISRLRRP